MVPEGWRSSVLGDVVTYRKGYAFDSKDFTNTGIRVIRISDTTKSSVHSIAPVFVSVEEARKLRDFALHTDDIILSTVGSRPPSFDSMVGKAVCIPVCANGSLLNQNLVKLIPQNFLITNEYLFSIITKSTFIYFITTLIRGNANQVSITLKELFEFQFLLPPLPQQKKIASILSTWDKAIETVEKLIENSKAQKKALMQQLLTGKRRLPGFSETWREVQLKAIAKILISNVDKITSPDEKPVRLCNYTDVYYNDYITNSISFMEATAKPREIEKFKLLPGDVIITKDSETPEDIAIPAVVSEALNGVVCGYHLAIIRPQNRVANGVFLSKLLSAPAVRHYFFSLANGATRFGLTTDAIANAKLFVPELPEQQRIGEVLLSIDRGIENQAKQLDALKEQKKALMQQLLTGKRRVKVDES